jgi:hypothetical protein
MSVMARVIAGRHEYVVNREREKRDAIEDERERQALAVTSFFVRAPTALQAARYRDSILQGRLYQAAVELVGEVLVGWAELTDQAGTPIEWEAEKQTPTRRLRMSDILELAEFAYDLADPSPEDFG